MKTWNVFSICFILIWQENNFCATVAYNNFFFSQHFTWETFFGWGKGREQLFFFYKSIKKTQITFYKIVEQKKLFCCSFWVRYEGCKILCNSCPLYGLITYFFCYKLYIWVIQILNIRYQLFLFLQSFVKFLFKKSKQEKNLFFRTKFLTNLNSVFY